MKNPFKNTDNYMIVKQFNRLTTRKRSFSNDSQDSFKSWKSNKYIDYVPLTKNPLCKSRINKQYLINNPVTNVYNNQHNQLHSVERRRAEVFGIQELRYKPSYFQNLDKYKDKYKDKDKEQQVSKSKKQVIQKNKGILSNKSQKSIKQIKFMHSLSGKQQRQGSEYTNIYSNTNTNININTKKQSQRKIQTQTQIQRQRQRQRQKKQQKQIHQQQQYQISSRKLSYNYIQTPPPPQKLPQTQKRDSIVEQMIDIGMRTGSRFNQFYASGIDLKSKSDIYASSLSIAYPRKQKRKISLFYDQHSQDNSNNLTKKYSNDYYQNDNQSQYQPTNQFQPQQQQQQQQQYQQQTQNLSKLQSQKTQQQAILNYNNQKSLRYSKCSNKTIPNPNPNQNSNSNSNNTRKYSNLRNQRYEYGHNYDYDAVKEVPNVIKVRGKIFYRVERNGRSCGRSGSSSGFKRC